MIIKNHTIVLEDTSPSELARFRQIFLGIWRQQIEDNKNTIEMEKFFKEKYVTDKTSKAEYKIKLKKTDEIFRKNKVIDLNDDDKFIIYTKSDSISEDYSHNEVSYTLNNYITFVNDSDLISYNIDTPPNKGSVRIVINLGGGADIDDAANTRVRQIEKYNINDKLIYITDDNLGNLKSNIESQIKEAIKSGYGKTVELSVFSHSGNDGPKGYYDPNNSRDLSKETGSEYDKGQMSLKNWGDINYNFDTKKSIASFYGCNSYTWAEKFLSITNVKHTAGNTGTAGGYYNTKGKAENTVRNMFGLRFGSDIFMRSVEDGKILPMYLYTKGNYIKNEYGTFLAVKEVYGNPSVPNH